MPYHYAQRANELERTLQQIRAAIHTPVEPLQIEAWITDEPVPFSERHIGRHEHFILGQSWGQLWNCAWFHFTGTIPPQADGQAVDLLIDLSGEGCVFDEEGCPVLGLTTVSSDFDTTLGRPEKRVVPLTACARGGETIDLWVEAGCNDLFGKYQDSATIKEAHIALYHPIISQLYHDFEVLHDLATHSPQDTARAQQILHALHHASSLLATYTEEEAIQACAVLAPELAKQGGTPSLQISAIGHAHIDLAWLWPIRETIRKGARTFATALAMLDRYPAYVFGASQPQLYLWMKERYPQLYAKIRQRISEGRWEAQGAMWVEPDTNLSGGEALVRQVLYGKRFFRAEFGKDPKMLWLPDVFGYTASLPQILRKSGVDYFLTIKISWNLVNTFPHHTFFWQGIDGSCVLVHMPPEGTYNSSGAPRAILDAEKHFADKAISQHAALLYGIGDGGGGPGVEHLERLERECNLAGLAPVVQEPMERFFQRLAQEQAPLKNWTGELYLERHQGTYTTQSRNKRWNRKIEYALRELELVASLAHLQGRAPYPSAELATIWQEVLLYQFHDILPGSSITRVYAECLPRYGALWEQIQQLTSKAEVALLEDSADERMYTISNSLSWPRRDWVQCAGQWRQVTVPALGTTTLDLATPAPSLAGRRATPTWLENDLLAIRLAPDGSLSSVLDKEYQREVLAPGSTANRLAVYHDEGDAWDFSLGYDEQTPHFFALEHSEAKLDGPRALIYQTYRYGQSTLHQTLVLTLGSRRLDFLTTVDWHEEHKMLRTSFPVAVSANEVTCDIQFGTLKRPTHRNTSWDMARTEICAHKYIDLSQGDYGVALLNDCKYGHKVTQNVLDLNLLRSPTYPDPQADRAEHTFTYSLYSHSGDHLQGKVMRAGYELNIPLRVSPGRRTWDGESLLTVTAPNIVVESIKKAEDSDNLILRLYESAGALTTTTIELNPRLSVAAVWLTNLLEEPEAQMELPLKLSLKPFEIVTLSLAVRR